MDTQLLGKFDSRKFMIAFYTISLAAVIAFVPPMVTFWAAKGPMILLTGSQFAYISGIVCALYKSADLFDKYLNGSDKVIATALQGDKDK